MTRAEASKDVSKCQDQGMDRHYPQLLLHSTENRFLQAEVVRKGLQEKLKFDLGPKRMDLETDQERIFQVDTAQT